MKKIIAILGLLVASCSQPNVGADKYQFGKKQYENSSVTVKIVTYKSTQALLAEARKYGSQSENLVAFSLLDKNKQDVCTIHIMDPSVKYEPEFVGHEFLHCVYGQWHTDNNSFN